MKIGIYAGAIPPPVFINNLVNGLADKGDTIFIYGKVIDKNYQIHNSNIIQKRIPSTKFGIILHSIFTLIRLITSQPHLYISLVKIVRQNSNSWGHFFYRCCNILPPFLDKLDIFHIQWAKILVEYPEIIKMINCPVVLSLRGTHISCSPLSDNNLAKGYKKYFPMVTMFHAVSNAIKSETVKYGADTNKITIIYPAINQKLINNIPKINNPNEIIKIISVGRCHWKKGYTFALDAMAKLKKEYAHFHYTIVADGSDTENIDYQIYDLGLVEYVSFVNGLSHAEVIDKVSSSDLFLLPSLSEGISNAVLEAMSLGVPVITTDCGGMLEIIRDGKNGFSVPVRDSDAMVEAIRNFINLDEKNKTNIINNARETIINNHLLSNQIDMFQSLYRNILRKV
jgi:colanic acid/amylovoran biosynthesis glycosyltransferase